jgi:hypothetical protein
LPLDKLKAQSTAEGLRVDPEQRIFTPPSKAGLGAAEWVNQIKPLIFINWNQAF